MTITLLNLCLKFSSLLPTNLLAVGSCSTPTIANSPLTILFEVFSVSGREEALEIEYQVSTLAHKRADDIISINMLSTRQSTSAREYATNLNIEHGY